MAAVGVRHVPEGLNAAVISSLGEVKEGGEKRKHEPSRSRISVDHEPREDLGGNIDFRGECLCARAKEAAANDQNGTDLRIE